MLGDGSNLKKWGIRQNFFNWNDKQKDQTSKEWMVYLFPYAFILELDPSLEGCLQSSTRFSPCLPGWNAEVVQGFVNRWVIPSPAAVPSLASISSLLAETLSMGDQSTSGMLSLFTWFMGFLPGQTLGYNFPATHVLIMKFCSCEFLALKITWWLMDVVKLCKVHKTQRFLFLNFLHSAHKNSLYWV